MGELERLRTARENMSSKYPLSPDIWLSWLRDEIKLAMTLEQRDSVTMLCERAIKDYLSVDIWLEYLQFSIGSMGLESNAMNNIRQLFERALTAVGLHVTKGAIIWEAYREFETVLLSMIDSGNEREIKEHLNHIGGLFRRQLACPLLDMEKTLQEYEIWRKTDGANATIDENIVMGGYERAWVSLKERLPFEEKLVSAQGDNELWDAYQGYLLYEKKNGDPGRVNVLYERAVAELSLEPRLWLDYMTFLENNLKIESILADVFVRASRNIPWCAKIWQKWIRAMEKWNKPLLEVQALLENALTAGFPTAEEYRSVWIMYIEYLRRRINHNGSAADEEKQIEVIRKTFERACEHLAKLFGLQGDPNCVILQYWARTEAIHANDMEKARSLWSDILSQGHSPNASSWLEYISLEKCYGDTKHLRKLYQKALSAVKDWPESIVNSWIDFERDEGTLEQMEHCETKVNEKMEKVLEERQNMQQNVSHDTENVGLTKKSSKRKPDDGRWKNLGVSPHKQARVEKPKARDSILSFDNKMAQSLSEEPSTSKSLTSKSKIAPPPGFPGAEEEKMDTGSTHEVDDKITVFVSNLDYTATEKEVEEALTPVGPVTLVRLVQDYKGRSKGFGYVQLIDSDGVERALQLDRTPIKGRPMFISRCDPNKTTRGPGFKYRCTLEKNKLFVKGLPVSTTKEDLEKLFEAYGSLKDVRLVTYRNGHSKGLAYVEFMDETSTAKALLATDGITVGDKIISVAISQPPERRKTVVDEVPQIKSLGGTSVSRTAFGGPKTLLSMIPRNVKAAGNSGPTIASGNGAKQPLNNQDFRKMLLNKK
ncbi:squamous cell carcinoma antigen recognized by T-cells 3-like isoform X2 [Venturia canescens]|nr:squamous cell carcinoma antigen recognized by T-cells 3-like isoform X2 [Venturia canescens]